MRLERWELIALARDVSEEIARRVAKLNRDFDVNEEEIAALLARIDRLRQFLVAVDNVERV